MPRDDLILPGGQPAKPTRILTDKGRNGIIIKSPTYEAAIETDKERLVLEGTFMVVSLELWQRTLAISLGKTAAAITAGDGKN